MYIVTLIYIHYWINFVYRQVLTFIPLLLWCIIHKIFYWALLHFFTMRMLNKSQFIRNLWTRFHVNKIKKWNAGIQHTPSHSKIVMFSIQLTMILVGCLAGCNSPYFLRHGRFRIWGSIRFFHSADLIGLVYLLCNPPTTHVLPYIFFTLAVQKCY